MEYHNTVHRIAKKIVDFAEHCHGNSRVKVLFAPVLESSTRHIMEKARNLRDLESVEEDVQYIIDFFECDKFQLIFSRSGRTVKRCKMDLEKDMIDFAFKHDIRKWQNRIIKNNKQQPEEKSFVIETKLTFAAELDEELSDKEVVKNCLSELGLPYVIRKNKLYLPKPSNVTKVKQIIMEMWTFL